MSSHPAHVARQPGLAALMHARANPRRVEQFLGERFATCAVYYVHGCQPFYYALVCRDKSGDLRLAVLFWNCLGHGWLYEPYTRQDALKLRLEEPA